MNSSEWFQRAQKVTPGGVNSPVRSFKHVGGSPIYFARAEAAHLYDVDGNSYTDFCMAFGPHLLGHSPLPVVRAVQEQITQSATLGACHPKEVLLAERLLQAYPFLDQVRLVNSGTEAVMTAVRLARGVTGRSKVIFFEGCYHGHSDGFLAKAGSGLAHLSESSSLGVPASVVSETLVAQFNDLEGLDRLFQRHSGSVAALVLEPIPANNGLWVPSKEHLKKIVAIARHHGALVVFDEVICGFRIGLNGACGYFDLQPDLVTLGKVIGGGLPLAAVVGTGTVMQHLAPCGGVYQAGTLSGNPVACAAGLAVLETVFENPPYALLEDRTRRFAHALELALGGRTAVTVRSVASLFWICFGDAGENWIPNIDEKSRAEYAAFFKRALNLGIYLPPSPYEVGFVSTAHTPELLESAVEKLAQCVGC